MTIWTINKFYKRKITLRKIKIVGTTIGPHISKKKKKKKENPFE